MRRTLLIFGLVSMAHADPDARVDDTMRKAVGDIKDCGGSYRGVFDWAAYEAIDWNRAGKDPREYLASERSTLASLGIGVNLLCGDPDYRAVLGRIDTIVYRPTDDKKARLHAVVSGTTLTFTDYTFGSTRDVDDFEAATKLACENAPVVVAPATESRRPVTKPGPASGAWDGSYQKPPALAYLAGVCFRPDVVATLTVSGGRFSFPWYVDDWTSKGQAKVLVGRVDGVVQANGRARTTVTFAEPVLRSTTVHTVKFKRRLEAIKDVTVAFSAVGPDKVVMIDAEADDGKCHGEWEILATRSKPRRSGNNLYPDSGPELSGDTWRHTARYDAGTKYARGFVVYESYASFPRLQFFACRQQTCDLGPPGNGWVPSGWE